MGRIFLLSFLSLLFISCGSSSKDGETTVRENTDISLAYSYNRNSKYSKILKECLQEKSESCSLSKLPFISNPSNPITKSMIMERVFVSHDWMGERFSEVLDILDEDIKFLLGSVTAIVIADSIKPSFYWSKTGAIYLDPRYLWLNPQEAKTIIVKDDYRSSYGDELIFENFNRFVKNNQKAYSFYSLHSNKTRTIDDIKLRFASLMYHELTHANDYLPFYLRNSLDNNLSVSDALNKIKNKRVSIELDNSYPLQSEDLIKMGKIMYKGKKATLSQKKITAEEIGSFYENDYVSSLYAYSSIYEDTATLSQMFLMKYHYDLERDVAFLDKPSGKDKYYCEDYIVKWGERNSIAKTSISQRAVLVLNKILPNNQNWNKVSNNLGEVKILKLDIDWCSSLDINNSRSIRDFDKKDFIKENFTLDF
ncbi:MAG: hypothetical protein MJK08_14210 [Campylobacterales bacterium]|nr:hypothetical protein [Campylobacterales bacterium]NQY20829.1 hypothetical protein [Campylobacteraceae bacterium]